MRLLRHLEARPRLVTALATGAVVYALLPEFPRATTRLLAAWDVVVWLFVMLALAMMVRADHERLRRSALLHAEGAPVVLAVVVAAAAASVFAIVYELSAAKGAHGAAAWPHLLFAVATVIGAWLLLPVLFTMNYASLYHAAEPVGGLRFPDDAAGFEPDYIDFLYFALTIAVASQTADVAVVSRPMRRLVLVQALLSFAFNTAILALTINIAASLF